MAAFQSDVLLPTGQDHDSAHQQRLSSCSKYAGVDWEIKLILAACVATERRS